MTNDQPVQEKNQQNALWVSLGIAWELGYVIALPIVILGFGGAYADKKFGTSPLYILIGIGFAIVMSGLGLYRKIKTLTDRINGKK